MKVGPENRCSRPALFYRRARCLIEARPVDYMLAMSVASASLPLVGKRLRPLGAVTAMGIWATRVVPDMATATLKSWMTPGIGKIRRQEREQTNAVSDAALRGVLPQDLVIDWPAPERTPPLCKARRYRRHLYRASVQYGADPSQLLDVWRRAVLPTEPAPVLVFVPGGGWVLGGRVMQGYALMSHLAEQGWVCLSIDYRVSPHHRWPQHLIDVKSAVAWARANADKFGGDRDFVAIAGCSAGGHLSALAGLTADDRDLEIDLPERSDTSVDAVVSIYGRYDWEDRSTVERERFMEFLEKVVVQRKYRRHQDIFRKASPIARVRADAPPFLVVHGRSDTVIPVDQARSFVERLRTVSRSVVSYIELPGAGHAFDMTDGARTGSTVTAIGLFLKQMYQHRSIGTTKEVI